MTIISLLRYVCALLLASAGIAAFEFEVAESHYNRRGRSGSASKAVYWARRAASHGSLKAQYAGGVLHCWLRPSASSVPSLWGKTGGASIAYAAANIDRALSRSSSRSLSHMRA